MFPDFPDFLPLSIELKDTYNKIIEPFTPYSDISFATLQIWWNVSENLSVSVLNNNLVINYSLFHDAENSGMSLVGSNQIDESIISIFEFLKSKKQKLQLVHVPEFVVDKIRDKSLFDLDEEHDYNEYILDSAALAKLEGSEYQLLRKKIRRFLRETDGRELEIRSLDLTLAEIQDELFASIAEWSNKNKPKNDPENTEHQALTKTFNHSSRLDIKNLAVYIDKKLHGIIIYHRPLSKEYFVLHHLKANYETPYISDYLHHEIAKEAVSKNVTRLNVEMDLGIETLRKHKMTLRPVDYLKKYTIRPAKS